MARRRGTSDSGSVRGHSIEDLYTMLRENRRFPEGVCRNYELDPPFFDCDELENMTRPEAIADGLVVVKTTENEGREVKEVTEAE